MYVHNIQFVQDERSFSFCPTCSSCQTCSSSPSSYGIGSLSRCVLHLFAYVAQSQQSILFPFPRVFSPAGISSVGKPPNSAPPELDVVFCKAHTARNAGVCSCRALRT